MPVTMELGQSSDCATPVLDILTSAVGEPVDVAVLEFAIYDLSTPDKEAVPVKVHPLVGDREAVSLDPCPAGGRLDLGHYVAPWAVPGDAALGRHEIRWWFKFDAGGQEFAWTEEVQIVAEIEVAAGGERRYCTVQQVRDEGVTEAVASDARIEALAANATMQIDTYCRWWFDPRLLTLRLHGNGRQVLPLPAPALRVDAVDDYGETVDPADLQHLGAEPWPAGLPYDPEGPALGYTEAGGYSWTPGRQTVTVVGVFGRTEADGSALGRVPLEIQRACALMVVRAIDPAVERLGAPDASRLISLRTRSQSAAWAALRASEAPLTGIPEIDDVLLRYRRPMEGTGV